MHLIDANVFLHSFLKSIAQYTMTKCNKNFEYATKMYFFNLFFNINSAIYGIFPLI